MKKTIEIQSGWLSNARRVISSNYNQRPEGAVVRLIVLHNISLPPAFTAQDFEPSAFDHIFSNSLYVEDFFQNKLDSTLHPYFEIIKDMKVSAHLLIARSGEVIQFVSFDERAWHAGRSCYLGVAECNDYSIGIELEGADDVPFSEAQYTALAEIIPLIQQAYPETLNHLAGHSDIAPGRKTDPGIYLNWMRIRSSLR
ncbi:MAG: 1,6-anhydro-N-acetylmuramyl-L-alanine amidase AmpD [Candidatus Saccharibacteria bacterium]|nr:1,6-anhydro-N-acetylmuramyl-L-alanine amidase AmpD [Moraxellaceae bacterium]